MNYIERSYQCVSEAIGILAKKSVNISIPLKPNFAYDILLEDEKGELFKIKVIKTEAQAPSGTYIVNLRKSGGYNRKKEVKKPFDPSANDMLFIISPEGSYMIPSGEIGTTRALSLSQYENFKIIPS